MGVFAKLDGLKRPPVASDVSMNYEKIRWIFKSPRGDNALQAAGLTKSGIGELAEGRAVSNQKDRKIVAAIVAAAVG